MAHEKGGFFSHNPCRVPIQCSQHIRVQVGDPLFAFLGDAKVTQGALDVRVYNVPVELRVALAKIAGCLVAELLIEADLLELVEEGSASEFGLGSFLGRSAFVCQLKRIVVDSLRNPEVQAHHLIK